MGNDPLIEIIRSAGGTLTRREAERAGATKHDLYRLRDAGAIVELSRGVYRLRDAPAVAHLDLLAVCRRVEHGTICLDSALAYWDLTDEMPAEVHVAVPRGSWRPQIAYPATAVHVFATETFALGRVEERLESGEHIWVYSPQRSVVDALRLRRRVGRELGLEGLRRYLARPGARRGELLRLARRLRAGRAMSEALDVLG